MESRRATALVPALAIAVILSGGLFLVLGRPIPSERIWMAGLALTGLPIVWKTVRGLLARHFAADIVASLAILTALALLTPLPGLIVVLMQSGGEALERHAEGRASNAVKELEAMAPSIAHRLGEIGSEDIPVDRIATGDVLIVRAGELVPCDAIVLEGCSAVDASRLTGEAIPVDARPGTPLMSGSVNGASLLTVRSRAPARESQYARIVELVRTAQASKSPFQRLADRYAIWFTPLTLAICGIALAVSHDWIRILAILVVATPCPLILATPIAIIGGINQAARRMVIFRHGGAIERLGAVTAAVFDKTGTLTIGRPRVSRVVPLPGFDELEVLRLASGVEQGSSHPMARTLVEAAEARGLLPGFPAHTEEAAGQGVWGEIEGRQVAVGGRAYVTGRYPGTAAAFAADSANGSGLTAFVAIDARPAGVIEYADALRPDMGRFIRQLRELGIRRILLLSGDSMANARQIADGIGIDEADGNLLPADKAQRVRELMDAGERVVMVGDGTNDAPALSTADVGVALATGGGGISAEAADVVLLADDPARLVEAIAISRRTLRIARQSLRLGMALSGVAILLAAVGMIPPTLGAILQEGIDVAVILNAVRTSVNP